MEPRRLDLVFLWHMHQPDYRDSQSGKFLLPWVLLHAIKDYADMADHLERHPQIRAVVNFVPVLLDQIEDYAEQIEQRTFRDPLLRLLAEPQLDAIERAEQRLLLDTCFRSNHATMLSPFPHYRRLHEIHNQIASAGEAQLAYLSGAYFADLITWYFLAWSGETERRKRPLLKTLMDKGENFSAQDRSQLLDWVGTTVRSVIPRYRALAARGQIELSTTPHSHPLAPLLLDFASARQAMPAAPLPSEPGYSGGGERLDAHIALAVESHRQRFGAPPAGMWPAEGALSTECLGHFARQGVRWLASGEGVLKNSLAAAQAAGAVTDDLAADAHRPWQCAENTPLLFFRDEQLSDLIGFEYAKWHGRDAARDLVNRLTRILDDAQADATPVVGVMLDGENAWEHYPYNGYYFFEELYGLLETQRSIRTTTLATVSAQPSQPPLSLPGLIAGSWVYGTLSTWIGDVEKNHAWDLLARAKRAYDAALTNGRLTAEQIQAAEKQLRVCESSDWFWWFGDYNPAHAVASFDRLYRHNLTALYRLIGSNPPLELQRPISAGDAAATHDGAMRRSN